MSIKSEKTHSMAAKIKAELRLRLYILNLKFSLAVQDILFLLPRMQQRTNVRILNNPFLSFLERQSFNLCTYSIVVGQQFVSSVNRRRRKPSKLTMGVVQRMC